MRVLIVTILSQLDAIDDVTERSGWILQIISVLEDLFAFSSKRSTCHQLMAVEDKTSLCHHCMSMLSETIKA